MSPPAGAKPPVAIEHRIRLRDGRALACLELGDAHGSPVLYCHGYPGSRLAAAAAGRLRIRLFAPDRPGAGGSACRPGRSLGDWAADAAELADHFKLDRFSIIGVSGGGPYALACAALIPDRPGSVALVSALGPVAGRDGLRDMIPLNRVMLGLAPRCPPLARGIVRILAQWIRRYPDFYFVRMMGGIPEMDRRVLADPAYHALLLESMVEAVRQGGCGPARELMLFARSWDFSLDRIREPVRIWQGLSDNIVPAAMARQLAAAIPGSMCHYLPGEGHFSLIYHHHEQILADLIRCGS